MRSATEVFGQWLEEGKDIGMQHGHTISVQNMTDFALQERVDIGKNFSFLDLGCGNGWVVRQIAKHNLCNKSGWDRWSRTDDQSGNFKRWR